MGAVFMWTAILWRVSVFPRISSWLAEGNWVEATGAEGEPKLGRCARAGCERGTKRKESSELMPTPRYQTFMPDELVDRLFVEFKNDRHRWAEFAERELVHTRGDIEEPPGRAEIVYAFVREQLGPTHGYEVGGLIIKIRKAIHGLAT